MAKLNPARFICHSALPPHQHHSSLILDFTHKHAVYVPFHQLQFPLETLSTTILSRKETKPLTWEHKSSIYAPQYEGSAA